MNNTDFDDIRPYFDTEVNDVLARVLATPDFIRAMAHLRFPKLARIAPWFAYPLVSWGLKKRAAKLNTVHDVQLLVLQYLEQMKARTVSEMTVSGIENLPKDKACLFISNHRDIVLDPALVNYALHENGQRTIRIAVGDNLMTEKYVEDLIRVNKSFVVKRSAKSPREKLKASKQLSAFIYQSLTTDNEHIWIAQREGRAKNGDDRTNPAVISMLGLNRPKTEPFADYVKSLNIVPVAISYEWDPCDVAKAKELHCLAESGCYAKQDSEDLDSIVAGFTGQKGHIHLAFGQPLQAEYDSAEAVAAAINEQIWQLYLVQPSNLIAYKQLQDATVKAATAAEQQASQLLAARMQGLNAKEQQLLLQMYAQPIVNQRHEAVVDTCTEDTLQASAAEPELVL
ncbi:1-acyl-sn-glycerol-3-phosphate acyltransferase [Shewanella avicenniae]|uniref:1-acyl-sn-glycerol-3-phosphate acyltransferase n=1 Tax=Shewanella avicenniae TaxID=2814294 RepID=A0ABX7QWN7_9GAMM|nr:1-acyl-sn-glycerol-3-phosphate acyltransferase [Shewanella avicenniae]QSX35048.1 1-acyl-sn-glycerol-3-phosphate acyltransferase [Shewanella avicenniae]